MDIVRYMKHRRDWVDRSLRSYLPQSRVKPSGLHRAIRYSLFAGGKRLRPILALAAYEAIAKQKGGGFAAVRRVLPVVSAIELVHTYSLVHDDLPPMDNDDFRRGRPTNHKVFGEPAAILVGDSLLTVSFTLLSDQRWCSGIKPDLMLKIMHELGEASGSLGMVGGQFMDIASQGNRVNEKTLHYIHTHKTGALIRASIRIGGLLGGATYRALSGLTRFGEKIGLAFQIADDVLDVEGDPKLMGKGVRKDSAAHKLTYPGVVGLRKAKSSSKRLLRGALTSISRLDHRADPLRELARYMIERKH